MVLCKLNLPQQKPYNKIDSTRGIRLNLERELWGSYLKPIKSSHKLPTIRHRCNFEVCSLAQSRGDGHRSLVTSERVFTTKRDLNFFDLIKLKRLFSCRIIKYFRLYMNVLDKPYIWPSGIKFIVVLT